VFVNPSIIPGYAKRLQEFDISGNIKEPPVKVNRQILQGNRIINSNSLYSKELELIMYPVCPEEIFSLNSFGLIWFLSRSKNENIPDFMGKLTEFRIIPSKKFSNKELLVVQSSVLNISR